jgi:hypothetical protein
MLASSQGLSRVHHNRGLTPIDTDVLIIGAGGAGMSLGPVIVIAYQEHGRRHRADQFAPR